MKGDVPFLAALPLAADDAFAAMRRSAREHFLAQGFPDRGNEAYKFSDLSALGTQSWPRAPVGAEAAPLPPPLGERALWLDGRLADNAAGDRVGSLAGIAKGSPLSRAALIGEVAPADDPIVALNTACFDHGAWIVTDRDEAVAKPIELVFAAGRRSAPAAVHARIALRLGAGSRLTIIERQLGGGSAVSSLATRVAEIVLDAGAELTHLRLNEADEAATLLGCTAVRLGEGASYRCLSLDLGAKFARETLAVTLAGDDAAAELAGLALLSDRQHSDHHVTVEHEGLRTRSRQHFRGVLDGRSRGIYSGLVRVRPGAQKADSKQESANLLLSRNAEADCRPQLEIYADDVACTHGAATGAIDADALFYLQSRAVDEATARRMIAYGFASRVLSVVEDHGLHAVLARLLAERMEVPAEVREWL